MDIYLRSYCFLPIYGFCHMNACFPMRRGAGRNIAQHIPIQQKFEANEIDEFRWTESSSSVLMCINVYLGFKCV